MNDAEKERVRTMVGKMAEQAETIDTLRDRLAETEARRASVAARLAEVRAETGHRIRALRKEVESLKTQAETAEQMWRALYLEPLREELKEARSKLNVADYQASLEAWRSWAKNLLPNVVLRSDHERRARIAQLVRPSPPPEGRWAARVKVLEGRLDAVRRVAEGALDVPEEARRG
jgi:DNA repair exonuclease SbcCD ATPase subunit